MSQDILENINFITSIISRDNNAWTDLYYAVAPRLRSFIIGRLTQLDKYINIDETANDVVVQTFEKAFNKIDSYKQELSKIKTWIFSIALHLVEDIKRELTKHRSLINDLKDLISIKILNREVLSVDRLLLKIGIKGLKLSDLERKYIELMYIENLQDDFIAEMLEVKTASIRVARKRLLDKLRVYFNVAR